MVPQASDTELASSICDWCATIGAAHGHRIAPTCGDCSTHRIIGHARSARLPTAGDLQRQIREIDDNEGCN